MPGFDVFDEAGIPILQQILRQTVRCAFRSGISRTSDGNQALYFLRILRRHVAAHIGTAAVTNEMCLTDSQLIEEQGHVVRDHAAVPGQIIARGPSVTAEIRIQAPIPTGEGKNLSGKSQQSPAEMAVQEQDCFAPAKFLIKHIQVIQFCIRHMIYRSCFILFLSLVYAVTVRGSGGSGPASDPFPGLLLP